MTEAPPPQLLDRQKFWAELDKLTASDEVFTYIPKGKSFEKEVRLGKSVMAARPREVIEAIFQRWEATGGGHPKHLALILGTAYRETCGLLSSAVGEACGCHATCSKDALNTRYGAKDQCGRAYFGRGFVQLTHRENYAKVGKLLHLPLADYPDLAYDQNVAVTLLVDGVKNRWYAGKPLDRYLSDEKSNWRQGRDSVNPGSPNKAATGYLSCRFYGAIQVAYATPAPAYPVQDCIKLKNF